VRLNYYFNMEKDKMKAGEGEITCLRQRSQQSREMGHK